MKYLELKQAEIEIPEGKFIHDYQLWSDRPSGVYLVNDGLGELLVFVSAKQKFVNIISAPELHIIDTKPVIEDSLANELHKQLVHLTSEVHLLTLMKPQQSTANGLDGDAIMKLLAVAQKPELAKEL